MKWLQKLAGRAAPVDSESQLDPGLQTLFDEHGLAAFDRQLRFGDIAGEMDWNLDQDAGTLRLGADLVLPAQILGTTSAANGTWLWSWANPSVSDGLTTRARELARIGEERGLAVLTDPELDPGRYGDGHVIALAVAGLLDADAYYRCPHAGGEVYVLVEIPQVRAGREPPVERAIGVITHATSALPLPPTKAGITNYLRGLGAPVAESEHEVRVGDGEAGAYWFDELGRLIEITSPMSDDSLSSLPRE